MRIEEYEKLLETMTEEELLELIMDIRVNRQTITQQRVQAVKKKAASKNVKAATKDLSDEEKEQLRIALGLPPLKKEEANVTV